MTTRYSSSESDNSDIEDRNHSRTSTSSVEEEVVKVPNGVRKTTTTTTTTTTRTLSSSSSTSSSEENSEKATSAPGFIARVSSLPLVHDSVSTLHSIAKDNKYSRYALDTAGSAVETVSKYTEGYQTRLQPHISKVDQIATKSLDLFETTFPIVTKPTAEIVTQVKKPIVFVEESSKNAYTQIQSTIDTHVTVPVKSVTNSIATTAASTRDQITTAATSTRDQITTVAASTANNLTTAATTTATTLATHVNTRATPLVDGLETIVNRYLPADVDDDQSTVTQSNQATRVVDLGRSVSLRVTRRVSVSTAPIKKAAENNAAVVKSKESIQALNIRLTALVESLRLHAKELQENVHTASGEASTRVQTRVTDLSASLLSEIDSLSVYLKEHSPKLPEYVQLRLEPLMGFVNDRYVLVKGEITKPDVSAIQKARNILHLTTEETLPILQSAAQDVKDSLTQYQISIQENVNRGLTKVQEVNSSVSDAAARAVQSARVIVGAK